MEKVDYLIIGNGIAGLSAIKEIRSKDKDGRIALVSNEPYNTYYRVRLTELISKDFTDDEILVNKDDWYEENNITEYLNRSANELDTENNRVILDDGIEIEYSKLLLATGSKPFIPPMKNQDKEGFFALRSLDDLNEFKNYLEDCNKIAVVGGGLLGLEAAWSLKELGKEVTILQFDNCILGNQLDIPLAKRLEEELEKEGFKIYTNADVETLLGTTKVAGVRLKDGREMDVDAVLVSTGVKPNMDLVKTSNIEQNRGVVVDTSLKTNIENIYAAGDVIELNGVVLGLWTAGLEQGRIAGNNMVGGDMTYDVPKPFASLNIGPISLFSAGQTKDVDKVYEEIDGDNHNKLFVKDGKLVGCILYGNTKSMGKFRKAVFAKKDIGEFLEENNLKGVFK